MMRTYWIFCDYPAHLEHRVADMPMMEDGVVIYMDFSLPRPTKDSPPWRVHGEYKIVRRVLKHDSEGTAQYLEFSPLYKM